MYIFFTWASDSIKTGEHILESVIRVIKAVLKLKACADIKEVIRLYIFTMFTCDPYYESSLPAMEVMANSMFSFW